MENMVLPAHATTIDVLSDATLMDRLSTFEHYLGAIDHVQSLIVAYLLTEPYKLVDYITCAKATLQQVGVSLHMFATCSETMRPYKLAYFGLLLELQRHLQQGTVESQDAFDRLNRLLFPLTTRMNIKRIPQKPQERWTPDIGQDGLGIPTASAMIARRIGKKKAPGSPGKSKSQSPPEDAMSPPPDPMMKSVFTFKPLKRSLESPRKIVMYDATPVPSIASPPTLLSSLQMGNMNGFDMDPGSSFAGPSSSSSSLSSFSTPASEASSQLCAALSTSNGRLIGGVPRRHVRRAKVSD